MKLGFLASHGGSSMRALVQACRAGALEAQPRIVISNNSGAAALALGREAGLAAMHLSSGTHPQPEELDRAILDALHGQDVDLVVLSGYMRKLGPRTLERYRGRIINVHPALLPAFGGQGMYGDRVHVAVLTSGAAESGASVHFVTQEYDAGPLLAQRRVPVLPGDSVETLRARVQDAEQALLVESVGQLVQAAKAGEQAWLSR